MIKRIIICVLILGVIITGSLFTAATIEVNEYQKARYRESHYGQDPPKKERIYGGDGRVGWEYPVSGVPGTNTIIIWDD